jgi:hypothetical protein
MDDILKEEGVFEKAQTQAAKEFTARQLAEEMRKMGNTQGANGGDAQD